MTQIFRCVVVLACSIMAYGLSSMSQSVSAADGDSVKGKPIFQTKCAPCHGSAGKGDGPIGTKLKPPATDFTSAASKAKSQDELRNIIDNGVPKTAMKGFKQQITEADIQNVLAYVLALRE